MLKKIIVLFVAFLLFLPALAISSESPDEINQKRFASIQGKIKLIDVTTLKSWIENKKKFVLLDVREPDEINAIKIPAENSIEIPRGVIEFLFHTMVPDLEATVVVYCSHGKRSAVVTDIINGYGYKNIYSLKDGIYAWIKAGYQVENFYGTFEMQNFKSKLK
jgi:rhodanese-related sulfurtransferase